MRDVHLHSLTAFESFLDEDALWVKLVQIDVVVVKLLELAEQLLRNLAEFSLLEASFNVCQHVEISSALALELSTHVQDAARSSIELTEEHWWVSEAFQDV